MIGEDRANIKILLSALAYVSVVDLSIELSNAGMTDSEISSFNRAVMKIRARMKSK